MSSITMSIRLDESLKIRLEHLADVTHRSKSFLTTEAIAEYLATQEWQIHEISKGIEEADAGQLIDHNQIKKYWEKKRADRVDEGR